VDPYYKGTWASIRRVGSVADFKSTVWVQAAPICVSEASDPKRQTQLFLLQTPVHRAFFLIDGHNLYDAKIRTHPPF
jgi:hypothetical protein